MASQTRWTWVWVYSGSWWWTGRRAVVHGVAKSRTWLSDWTELNWTLKTTMSAASTGQQKGPNSSSQHHPTMFQKLNEWIIRFASSIKFTRSLANKLPLLQTYWQLYAWKKLPHQREAENAFHEFIKSQIMNFYATRLKTYFSLAKAC